MPCSCRWSILIQPGLSWSSAGWSVTRPSPWIFLAEWFISFEFQRPALGNSDVVGRLESPGRSKSIAGWSLRLDAPAAFADVGRSSSSVPNRIEASSASNSAPVGAPPVGRSARMLLSRNVIGRLNSNRSAEVGSPS